MDYFPLGLNKVSKMSISPVLSIFEHRQKRLNILSISPVLSTFSKVGAVNCNISGPQPLNMTDQNRFETVLLED